MVIKTSIFILNYPTKLGILFNYERLLDLVVNISNNQLHKYLIYSILKTGKNRLDGTDPPGEHANWNNEALFAVIYGMICNS